MKAVNHVRDLRWTTCPLGQSNQWTGPWIVRALRGPSVLLKMGITERAVHINRVCPLLTDEFKNQSEPVAADWTPLFNHEAEREATTSESSS